MKKKILYTIPNFDTAGSGKVVYDLLLNINKDEFEVHLLIGHDRGLYFKDYISKLPINIHVKEFKFDYNSPLQFFQSVLKFIQFINKNKINLIHSWDWSSNIGELLAAKLAGVKYVFTKKAMSWGSKSWIYKSKYSDLIIRLNDDMQRDLFDPIKISSIKIPIGLDSDYYSINDVLENPYPSSPYILTVANLVPIKGIEVLIESFKILKSDFKNLKLLIVGNNNSSYGQRLINDNCEDKSIVFIDKVMDVRPFLQFSEIFVIPTNRVWEGQPMAAVEAMSMSNVVIGSDISGISEVLSSFPEFLFTPGDSKELFSKINEFLKKPNKEREDYRKRMREEVLKRFGRKDFIQRHQNLYKEILHK